MRFQLPTPDQLDAALQWHRAGNRRSNIPVEQCQRIESCIRVFFDDLRDRHYNTFDNVEAARFGGSWTVPK